MSVGPYLISFDDERLDFFLLQQFQYTKLITMQV